MTVPARERRPDLLDTAAAVLTADPTASLAEIAAAAGMGRTTLHRIFPTREAAARLAVHAMERLSAAVEAAELGTNSAPGAAPVHRPRGGAPGGCASSGPAVWDLPEMRAGWYEVSATLEGRRPRQARRRPAPRRRHRAARRGHGRGDLGRG
jgi:AcrR family transcriptional regulator